MSELFTDLEEKTFLRVASKGSLPTLYGTPLPASPTACPLPLSPNASCLCLGNAHLHNCSPGNLSKCCPSEALPDGIHSITRYLLLTHLICAKSVLHIEDRMMDTRFKVPDLAEITFYLGETDNMHYTHE